LSDFNNFWRPPHLTNVSTLPCKTYRTSLSPYITYFSIGLLGLLEAYGKVCDVRQQTRAISFTR